jgi:broad specificity phosphatase PhoE
VFTSGGPITAICQNLLQVPDSPAQRMNWTMANCGVTKVIYGERSRYLSTLNEHAHFEGAHSKLITYR